MPGPAPKPNASTRNPRVGLVLLPAEGRKGDPPTWPLTELNDEEARTWGDIWHTPQAVAWERLGWTRVVARYVRVLVGAERMDDKLLAEARQLEDKLGLTPKAMRMLLWQIVDNEVGARRDERDTDDVRGRLRAVDSA